MVQSLWCLKKNIFHTYSKCLIIFTVCRFGAIWRFVFHCCFCLFLYYVSGFCCGWEQEEAFMAVGALADQMEKPFINYMEAFLPILIQGLSNNEEYQVRRFFLSWCWPCFSLLVSAFGVYTLRSYLVYMIHSGPLCRFIFWQKPRKKTKTTGKLQDSSQAVHDPNRRIGSGGF